MLFIAAANITAGGPVSIQKFGVLPGNSPQANREALQRAIDTAENRARRYTSSLLKAAIA